MQANTAAAQGLAFTLKISAIALIILIFISVALFGIPFSLRASFYQVFKKGVNVLLNCQTASFDTLESENIVLKYSKEDRDISAFVLDTAERYYADVSEMMNYRPKNKVLLVIYPNQETLNKSFGWAGDKSTAGAYWAGSVRIAWPTEESDPEKTKSVFLKQGPVSHELTHYIIDEKTAGNYPRWLSEGLAQYVEEKITGFRLEEPSPEQQKELYTLSRLEREYDNLPDQTLAYWQSLQAVRSLIDGYGLEKIHDMLSLLQTGSKIGDALQEVYGMSAVELESKQKTG